jgi:hypothetical protein
MHRRQFLQGAAGLSVLATGGAPVRRTSAQGPAPPVRRVRPADPSWPSEATWDRLRQQVAYLPAADNVLGPLPFRLRGLHQPVIGPPNVFSGPRPPLLACI